MTAGSVSVPTIVPLRLPTGNKLEIDTRTLIELRSDTPGAEIYYTVNGNKPDPFQKLGEKHTYVYERPFTLFEGKQTVRAIALLSNPVRESSVVTKTFRVTAVEGNESPNDENEQDLGRSTALSGQLEKSMGSVRLGNSSPTQPRFMSSRSTCLSAFFVII
jgi:hypothetical protein